MSTNMESQNADVFLSNMASNQNINEFTRDAIENMKDLVRLTDKDEATGLELFCYVKCTSEDNDIVRQCRGVVFHDDKIIMRAFPYTIEFEHTEYDLIEKNIGNIFSQCKMYTAEEGALIRMFYFGGKWFTCTHRKLNAFRSKWASKESFGTSFKKALEHEININERLRNVLPDGDNMLERFQTLLDHDKQYMFLIRHNEENRIVCLPPENPTLYHVGTFVNGNLVMTEDIYIRYPDEHKFANIKEMCDYVQNIDIREHQGIIIFAPDNKQYKILHQDYMNFFKARGNEPSIKYRYLQIRMNMIMVDRLCHLYPHMVNMFQEYENILYEVAKKIHNSYIKRHIKNKWSTLPNEEYAVDRACHAWHEQDRKNNRVSLEKILELLNEQTPTNLNKMIHRYHEEQQEQKDAQKKVMIRNRSNTIGSANTSPVTTPMSQTASPLLSKNHNSKIMDIEPLDINDNREVITVLCD